MANKELGKVVGLGHLGQIRQKISLESGSVLLWPLPQAVIPVRSPGWAECGSFQHTGRALSLCTCSSVTPCTGTPE